MFGFESQDFVNDLIGKERLDQAAHQLNQMLEETAKAYGGCTNCYGKGYASVNERWHGHDTDQDIGSPGGYVSGGNPNAMKFCNCARGKELEKRLNQMPIEAKEDGVKFARLKIEELASKEMRDGRHRYSDEIETILEVLKAEKEQEDIE